MMKKSFWLAIGILFPFFLWAQGQTSNWYFGNGAGMQFTNDGNVVPLLDGKLNTFEGCATISGTAGELLFYTDGITVYNAQHRVMDNGSGLYGDPSSTQSAIIVPKPDDAFIYYIFTVDTSAFFNDPDYGLNYSVVDMREDNGNGAVVTKNMTLLKKCTEKVAAVIRNCFDRSIWVITQGPEEPESPIFNTFYAFKVTASGIDPKPVKTVFPLWSVEDPRGYLKLSSDGSTLVSANYTSGLYVFDFDIDNGRPLNLRKIDIDGQNNNPYGLEFSPSNRWLYVHSSNIVTPPDVDFYSTLLQFDLEDPDPASTVTVLDERLLYRGALQLGENGKIYRTSAVNYNVGHSFLGVIHEPDQGGLAANYEHDAVNLNGGIATQGLPPFIQSFFSKTDLVLNDDGTTSNNLSLCEGDSFVLEIEDYPGAIYTWHKDGELLPGVDGNRFEIPAATPEDGGRYGVEITLDDPTKCPILGESFIDVLAKPDAEIAVSKCDYDLENSTDGITEIDLTGIGEETELEFEFFLNEDNLNTGVSIPNPGAFINTTPFTQTLWYKATNELGCTDTGTVQLEVSPGSIGNSLFGPIERCDDDDSESLITANFILDDIAALYPGIEVAFFQSLEDLAADINPLEDVFNTSTTLIYARKESGETCLGVDIVDLVVRPAPPFEMADRFLLCAEEESIVINAPVGFDEYIWKRTVNGVTKEISREKSLTVKNLGEYSVEGRLNYGQLASGFGCIKETAFVVEPSDIAVIEDIIVNDLQANNTIMVMVSGNGDYEFSMDGSRYQDENRFDDVDPGIRTVYVRDKNGCGTREREISVLGYPKFFTPNGDGVNDFWQLDGVNEVFQDNALITIYNRYGQFVTQIPPDGPGWDGVSQGMDLPASDYWFRVFLADGREVKGHFTLKR